ncbi:MAG: 1-deoxy-D-xylulose-5-phosphate reductoisomerase [Planctomycetes bacterium]|nr:1-deoxy-D-xylulose-5-phosphate reductoisomerase [Planctomycetota bacterium]
MTVSDDPGHRARALTVLGSTGSIGINTLAVAADLGIPVFAVTAHSKVAELARQARACRAQVAVIADETAYAHLKEALSGSGIRAAAGQEALSEVAAHPDTGAVVTAIVGGAGLPATLAAVRAGKRVCIANKEPLVMAGDLIMAEAATSGARILPIDSEHSAIFQCLEGHAPDEVERILLTSSGGPFRCVQDLSGVTRDQALVHPTWSMGPKITIDSATLMNKSLEIIEARWLFAVPVERIAVVIHPQSVVHSMVCYRDGSVMAQLGRPDMRVPIQYALTWPRHLPGPVTAPDFAALGSLTFENPDTRRFPSLDMAYAAARAGGVAPAVMNAANEMAVSAFLAGRSTFVDIFRTIETALAEVRNVLRPTLADILAADADVRARLTVR